jgi:uncharacterized membrane protein
MKLGLNTISLWFGCLMVLVTISGAIVFAFTDVMNDRLFGNNRIVMSVIFFAYAIYRSIRLYQSIKQMQRDDA